MSKIQDFKRWAIVWALSFAFNFPNIKQVGYVLYFLQKFFFNARSNWIRKEEGDRGYWIAEDLQYIKNDVKREAITDRIQEANVIILWIPGGGFRFNLGRLYTPTFATWIRALEADKGIKSMIFVADYKCGSDARFPTAIEQVADTYHWLVKELDINPSKIVIGGDDVGVAIAIDMLSLKVSSQLKPAGMICASPYTGMEAGGESWRTNLGKDILNENSVTRMENAYLGPEEPEDHEDSDDDKSVNELKPFTYLNNVIDLGLFLPSRMLIYLGGEEVLLDEGGALASRARRAGIDVMMVQEPTGIHLWSMLPDILVHDKNSRQIAMDRFVAFIAETTNYNKNRS